MAGKGSGASPANAYFGNNPAIPSSWPAITSHAQATGASPFVPQFTMQPGSQAYANNGDSRLNNSGQLPTSVYYPTAPGGGTGADVAKAGNVSAPSVFDPIAHAAMWGLTHGIDQTRFGNWAENHGLLDLFGGGKKQTGGLPDPAGKVGKGGFDVKAPAGKQGAAAPGDGYQQAIAALVKGSNGVAGSNFNVPYDQVTAQLVKPAQIPNPFGPKGYQPDVKGESALLGDALAPNYLSAFLPQEIENMKQIYGPEIASQILQGQMQANTIQGYNTGANELLSQIPGQVGQTYDQSIGMQTKLDQGIRNSLAGLNPDKTAAAAQGQIGFGAPAAQAQHIADQARTSFNGAGAVLGGMGDLNASSLAAQRAAAVSAAQELPGLNTLAGRQALVANMIGNNASLAKIQTQEGKDTLSAARQDQSVRGKQQSNELGAFKSERSYDAQMIAQQIGIDKTNASNATSAAVHNASAIQAASVSNATNALSAIRASATLRNAAINQERYSLSLVKAMYPQKTAAQQASEAKAAQAWFGAGTTYKRVPRVENGKKVYTASGSVATDLVPSTTGSYEDKVRGWATTHGGDIGQATAYANGFFNYGQGDRPFDPPMQEVLAKAGQNTTFYHDATLGAYITTDQALALQNGFKSFVSGLVKTPVPKNALVKSGIITQEQADATQGDTVSVWRIPPYGGNG